MFRVGDAERWGTVWVRRWERKVIGYLLILYSWLFWAYFVDSVAGVFIFYVYSSFVLIVSSGYGRGFYL